MNKKTLTAFTITALVLRLAGMWIPSLWYDENFTLILSRLPFDRMIAATAGDVHPPLWYLIEWSWSHLLNDPAPWTLRIPALVFSMLAFVTFAQVLKELEIPETVQIGAMTLMTILPFQIWYAQEARMYSLLEWLVLVALLAALRRQWVTLFLASLAMLYTQNYGMFYLATIGLIVFVDDMYSKQIRTTLITAACMFGAFALYLPWMIVLRSQMMTIAGRYWIQSPAVGDLLNMIFKLFWQASLPSYSLIAGIVITFLMFSVGMIEFSHASMIPNTRRVTLLMAFTPLFMAYTISLIWNPILLHRPLIGSAPFIYIIAAYPLKRLLDNARIKQFREMTVSAALVIPIMFSGLSGYYLNIPAMKNDGAISPLIKAFEYVESNWKDGDIIYMTDDGPMINLLPYSDLPMYQMDVCGERLNSGPVLGSLSPATRQAIGITIKPLDEIPHKRAWVFAPRSPLHPKCYEDEIAPLTVGAPQIVVDDNLYIYSAVWLVEE